MRVGCDRLVERVVRAWDGQRWHGLSGVGNARGGVLVVLKLEWQPLHPRTSTAKSCRGCSSSPPASSSVSPPSWPSWERGVFCFRSTPSPSWPLRQFGGFLLLVQPHHHLLFLFGFCGSFCIGSGIDASSTLDVL